MMSSALILVQKRLYNMHLPKKFCTPPQYTNTSTDKQPSLPLENSSCNSLPVLHCYLVPTAEGATNQRHCDLIYRYGLVALLLFVFSRFVIENWRSNWTTGCCCCDAVVLPAAIIDVPSPPPGGGGPKIQAALKCPGFLPLN